MTAVLASEVSKRFGRRTVLDDVSLSVPRGSAFGLVGPNGAGKTTFIKILLGIAAPSGGRVELLGQDPLRPQSRRRVGYLPERIALPEAWSATDFLRSVARLKGVADRPEPHLEEVGLASSAWRRSLGKLSKGMKQRVALAAALIGRPELLILDEPTDGIDPMGRIQVRELLRRQVDRGTTVFLNSHLLAETEKLCDQVAIMGSGRVLVAGALDTLRQRGRPRARFAEAPDLRDRLGKIGLVPVDGPSKSSGTHYVAQSDISPQDMSELMGRAIAEGLVLLELTQPAEDLEAVLVQHLEEGGTA